MQDEKVDKINGSLDWLTMTTERSKIGHDWADIWRKLMLKERKPASFFGFNGERAEGGSFYGRRVTDGRYIIILAGHFAHEYYPRVKPHIGKVTRLDLACDLWMSKNTSHIAKQAGKVLDRSFDMKCKVSYITGLKGTLERPLAGDTLYVGSRQSVMFGRLYDKGLQLGVAPPGKWLRYEVEYKSYAAKQVLEALNKIGLKHAGTNIQRTVHSWFKLRGIEPNYAPGEDCAEFKVRSMVRQKTKDKKLMWLRTQVQPTVQYLLSEGLGTEVTSALGLEGWTNEI